MLLWFTLLLDMDIVLVIDIKYYIVQLSKLKGAVCGPLVASGGKSADYKSTPHSLPCPSTIKVTKEGNGLHL